MFLMPVFAASVRALVTPVMMGTSIWGHQVQMGLLKVWLTPDLWSRELWLTRLRAPRTLRRVAVAVCVLDALVIAVAPYVTPRAGDQRGLYATLGAALAAVSYTHLTLPTIYS